MERRRTFFIISLPFLFAGLLFSCGESGLSKSKAKDIIDEHFKDWYGCFVPKKAEFTFQAPPSYKYILATRQVGLVKASQVSSMLGQYGMGHTIEKPSMGDTFTVALTEKGNAAPHVNDKSGNIGFFMGHRKIDGIVEIKKREENQFTVLFSYTFRFNDLGKEIVAAGKQFNIKMTDDNSKLRGKAIIAYDSFLKKYVMKSLLWSDWEKENWQPTMWITSEKDNRIAVMQ